MAERPERIERLERRTRLDQPNVPSRGFRFRVDAEAFGQLTEKIARFIGTGRFLVYMTVIVAAWILWNAFTSGGMQFDGYPFIFLTLMLSLQASYAAPLILLAQNRQSDRDRVNLDEDRSNARQAKADIEYLAREIAAVRIALGEVATRDFLRSELARLEAASHPSATSQESKKRRRGPGNEDDDEEAGSAPDS